MTAASAADAWWDSLPEDRRIAFHRWLGRVDHPTDIPIDGQLDLPLPLLTDRNTP
ncbi:hypothetical protein [Rhodococcus zopfii]|uniref:hypothetical protein n=1 Tax=Rhodococcus zopfii TaxID=43772 RepID=UPI000B267593|nr:hypothetical protein [Rhodococcus zopfii]